MGLEHRTEDIKDYTVLVNQLFFLLMLGNVIGTLFVNLLLGDEVLDIARSLSIKGVLEEVLSVNQGELLVFVIEQRFLELLLLVVLMQIFSVKLCSKFFFMILGFIVGVIVSVESIAYGIQGMVFVILLILPALAFYGGAVLCYLLAYEKGMKVKRCISLLVLFAMGIIVEVYVTPELVQLIS